MQDQDYENAVQKMKDLVDMAAWNAAVSDDEKLLTKFRKMQRVARKFAKDSGGIESIPLTAGASDEEDGIEDGALIDSFASSAARVMINVPGNE